jgi:DNA-binding XRE family transcriptional regulator
MKAQIIEKDGHPEFAVIPFADYERFLELIEDEPDARAVAEFQADYAAGKAFLVPDDLLRRERAGESPVKLWRIQRNLTQQALAVRAGISKSYLSQVETGKRQGTVETLKAIAVALDVPADVLMG